jgi:hypothetical protein
MAAMAAVRRCDEEAETPRHVDFRCHSRDALRVPSA